MRKLHLIVALAVLVISLLLVSPALAEGSWASYLSGTRVGFDTRRWYDNDNDAVSTYVTVHECRDAQPMYSNDSIELQLRRHMPGWFDDPRGNRSNICYYSGTMWWDRQPAGEYFLKITRITGSDASWQYISTRYPDGFQVLY